jgi:very-short-patch-repair endonuclease
MAFCVDLETAGIRPVMPTIRRTGQWRSGGRLTGVSAIAAWGGWVAARPRILHVAVAAKAFGVRHPPGVIIHWRDERHSGTDWAVGIVEALVRVALDEPLEIAVCAFDWAWSSGRLDTFGFESALAQLPSDLQTLRYWVDPQSQSVLESVARVRCLQKGWKVRSQVRVGDLQSIDLVIEDAVALERDGRRFHESTFATDRRKDLAITIEGRHALRVDAEMVFGHWADVERAIEQALAARGLPQKLGIPPKTPRGTRVRPGFAASSS